MRFRISATAISKQHRILYNIGFSVYLCSNLSKKLPKYHIKQRNLDINTHINTNSDHHFIMILCEQNCLFDIC